MLRATCARDELVASLGIASRGLSTRSAVQILSGIFLRGDTEGLHLAATDMEVSLRRSFDAEVQDEGAVVVPGRLLVDLARLLPEHEVTLEQRSEENILRVACGSAEYQLRTYAVEDFPRLLDPAETLLYMIDTEPLLDAIGRVGRAASRDEARPVLTGILVRLGQGRLVMAATDSYRLAVKEAALEGEIPDLEAIVPARALEELRRIAVGTERVQLGVHENQVVFGIDTGVWLTTRRIDGMFPDYEKLVPAQETFKTEARVSREELLDVVRRTAVLAPRRSPIRFRFDEGELTVFAQAQDVGESRETLPLAWTGERFEIGFDAEFVRDGLESIEGEEAVLKLIDPLRPGLIQGAATDFWYLIMPIRLAG